MIAKQHHSHANGRSFPLDRRGNILLVAAGIIIMVFGFAAFTIDIGYITLTKTQLQNAVDAAALAAAMELSPAMEPDEVEFLVREAAVEVASLNKGGDHDSVYVDFHDDIELGRRTWDAQSQSYHFDWGPTAAPYNVVKVTARRMNTEPDQDGTGVDRRLPLFFAPVIGHDKVALEVSAVATFQPRDMMLVLDYSASMNDDSEYAAIPNLGQAAIEANLAQMWADLGSPTYGDMGFEPEYVTFSGQPASGAVPHIEVTWKGDKISVVSTKDLSNVVLKYENNRTQKFEGLHGRTGTFQGTGSNSGQLIETCWIKSGSNSSGDGPGYGERFDITIPTIQDTLGLDDVPYPGNGGGWNSFVNYCIDYSYYNQGVSIAGYRYKFGVKSLIDYWNTQVPMHSQTPHLWQMSQQPITALKNSTDLLLNYLRDVEAEDEVGLAVYTYPDNEDGALLECELTTDFDELKTVSRQRQAGHYDQFTNIGAGMRVAREELVNNARPQAVKMMVLMTDGVANRSSTGASPDQFALDEADLAADAKIKIMTISLGANADIDLMQEIADRTGGIHFNVPGGVAVAEYEEQLKKVFAEIAADRPLKLIRGE